MSEQNKATARRVMEEIISGGNLDEIEEVFAADYHDHDHANEEDTRGADGIRAEVEGYRSGFDFQFTIEDQIAEGDRVANRWSWRGTHTGEAMGIPATGNEVTMTGTTIFRFAEGKIQEGWWTWDTLGMLQQIGAIPAEQPAS